MVAEQSLVDRFEEERPRLQTIATRIVGSAFDADDVVQEVWFRLERTDHTVIENLAAWLTVVASHIALDHVRARARRREESLDIIADRSLHETNSTESMVVFEETVYEALEHTLPRLSPLEAAAFVLHDLFGLPFDELSIIIDRSSEATRKLASRARHKVSRANDPFSVESKTHRSIVDAFMHAARTGDLGTLLDLLLPDAVLRTDATASQLGIPVEQRGATRIAEWFDGKAQVARITWFDGEPGAAWAPGQRIKVAFLFSIRRGKIEAIMLRSDPDWLAATDIEIEPRPRRKNAGG